MPEAPTFLGASCQESTWYMMPIEFQLVAVLSPCMSVGQVKDNLCALPIQQALPACSVIPESIVLPWLLHLVCVIMVLHSSREGTPWFYVYQILKSPSALESDTVWKFTSQLNYFNGLISYFGLQYVKDNVQLKMFTGKVSTYLYHQWTPSYGGGKDLS